MITLGSFRNACLLFLLAAPAKAQLIAGQVRDSVTGRALPGVVVEAFDPAGHLVSRTVTSDAGVFRLRRAGTEATLRTVRIGYRPARVAVTANDEVTIRMARLPNLLDPVRIVAARNCPRGWNRPEALGLLEQARAALLNSVVSGDSNVLSMKRLQFERTLVNDTVAWQSVRIDEAERTRTSYAAVRPTAEFIANGFVAPDGNDFIYYSPDANTLLDSAFSRTYCFRTGADELRPRQVALQFQRPGSGRGRVDIFGKLWVDTASRALVSLEFRYEGVNPVVDQGEPGGTVHFLELPNGMTAIDRWWLHLVVPERYQPTVRWRYRVSETGGEVARFTLPDGRAVESQLGAASLLVLNPFGKVMAHQDLSFDDTDYRATTDDSGRVVIRDLLPGPYKVSLSTPELDAAGITIPTTSRFKVERGGRVEHKVSGRSVRDFTYDLCKHDGIWNDLSGADSTTAWIVGRAVDDTGAPLSGVMVTAATKFGPEARSIRTGTDGVFEICTLALKVGQEVTLTVNHHDRQAPPVTLELVKPANVAPLIHFGPKGG